MFSPRSVMYENPDYEDALRSDPKWKKLKDDGVPLNEIHEKMMKEIGFIFNP